MIDLSQWTDWNFSDQPYVPVYRLKKQPEPEAPKPTPEVADPELPVERLEHDPKQPYALAQAIRHALAPFPDALRALIDHLAQLTAHEFA